MEANGAVSLSGGSSKSLDGPVVNILVPTIDLNIIKLNENFATNAQNVFLSLTSASIADNDENPVIAIESLPLTFSDFYPDFTSPELLSFVFDANSGVITLTFDEIIRVSTLNISGITIQNAPFSNIEHQLTSGYVNGSENGIIVQVQLSDYDRNRIKSLSALAIDMSTTWIRMDEFAFEDMNNNFLVPVFSSNAIQAIQYIPDLSSPMLLRYEVDLNASVIHLTFSETVDARTLNVTGLTLLSNASENAVKYQLVSSTSSTENIISIDVFLSREDSNGIKALTDLATSVNDTYLSISSHLVQDVNENPIDEIAITNPLPVSNFTADMISPILEQFIFDANLGQLILSFSETVDAMSFNVSQIVLQSSQMKNESDIYIPQSGDILTTYSPIVIIQLSRDEQNTIKQISNLATNENNTFISFTNMSVVDTFGNLVTPIDENEAFGLSEYIPDTTAPELEEFELDMNLGQLHLTFSETVNAMSIRLNTIEVQSSPGESNNSHILTTEMASTNNSPVLTVYLSDLDLNTIKLDRNLATTVNNTAIAIKITTIEDVFSNRIIATEIGASNFTDDTTQPNLISWYPVLNSSQLFLVFDEVVERDSLNVQSLTLQSVLDITFNGSQNISDGDFDSFTLQNGSSDSSDGLQIVIELTETDLNAIKQMLLLLRAQDSSFISLNSTFIQDMNVNPVELIPINDAFQATDFFDDSVQPYLRDFWLDMDSGNLTLSFSESVDAISFAIEGIVLQNQFNVSSTGGVDYMLMMGTIYSDYGPLVTVELSRYDLNELKRLGIARSAFHTWLTLDSSTVTDIEGNPVISLDNALTARQISRMNYMFDMTSPVLETFDIDLNNGTLTLYFSETVRASSLNATQITLLNNEDGIAYSLSVDSTARDVNLENITIDIGLDDLNNIKRLSTLAIDRNTTFLAITSSTIRDMKDNRNTEIMANNPISVNTFNPDTNFPQLLRFDFNLTTDQLILFFSETVNASSLNAAQITVQNSHNMTNAFYNLTGGYSIGGDDPIITVSLLNEDLNVIKQMLTLATASSDTFISFSSLMILDMFKNPVVAIPFEASEMVTNFYHDTVQPQLIAFDLDMNVATLTLYFSETVNSLSLNTTSITLQDNRTAVNSYQLEGGFTESINQSVIIVNISTTDFNELKRDTNIVTMPENSFIVITSSLIEDMNGNSVVEIPDSEALNITLHTPDRTSPILISWNLDMDIGRISLTFSETVNANSFDPSVITIQALPFIDLDSQMYTLLGGNSTEENSTVIEFDILRDLTEAVDDLNQLKNHTEIATSDINTYISFSSNLLVDMNGNLIDPLENGIAQPVFNFTNDTSRPFLYAFDIDMNAGELILTFDEVVNRSTLTLTEFTIQQEPNMLVPTLVNETFFNDRVTLEVERNLSNAVLNYTLTGGTVGDWNDQIIRIRLNFSDLNRIKRLDLCTDANRENDCFIRFTENVFDDMNGNPVTPIGTFDARMARFYEPDITPPALMDFVSFNFVTNRLRIEFTETINVSTFDPTQVTLQRWAFDDSDRINVPFEMYTLTGGENITEIDDITVEFTLIPEDLNVIKQREELCNDDRNCFIRFPSQIVSDMANNSAATLGDTTVVLLTEFPTEFVRDTVPPVLVFFDLDMNNGNISLTFDETISFTDITPTAISLFSSQFNETESLTLGGGESDTDLNWIYIQLTITDDDLIRLKSLENLATSVNDTWLENTFRLIEDQNGIDAFERDSTNRLQVSNLLPDVTPPTLVAFDFHLGTKILTLIADEPIYLPSVRPELITVISGSNISAPGVTHHQLTGGNVSYEMPEVFLKRRVNILLIDDDLFHIQLDFNLATNNGDTYLSIQNATYTDMFGNDVVDVPETSALQVNAYSTDDQDLQLLMYTIDLDTGTLDLTFDDTIRTDTFVPTGIILINNPENTTTRYRLTDDTYTNSSNGYNLRIILSQFDLNNIKNDLNLATSINNTFLLTDPPPTSPVSDTTDNPLAPITLGLQASNFTEDSSRPHLVYFDLDLNQGEISLQFNETVRARTLNVTNLILGNEKNFTTASYVFPLTGGNSTQTDSTQIIVALTIEDLNELKRITPGLATDMNDTYLAFSNDTLLDLNMNTVVEISEEDAIQVRVVIPDTIPPNLVAFDLDLSNENLTLTFDETVDASTFNVNGFTLVTAPNNSASFYTLQNGSSTQNDSTVITVTLDFDDLNEIKGIRDLAVSAESTYASVVPILVQDMSMRAVDTIPILEALQVTNFTNDQINPVLVSFNIDLNTDMVLLTFSETIRPETLNITTIVFVNALNEVNRTISYQLTSTNQTFDDTRFVTITFNKEDSDEIRRLDNLLTNNNNSFIVVNNDTIQDMNLNRLEPLILGVSTLQRDEVLPSFVSFDLDLNLEQLSLLFSETVRASSLNATQITLHGNNSQSYTLTGGYSVYSDNTTIVVQLTDTDLNALKRMEQIATSENNTLLSLTDMTIEDMSNNRVIEILPINAVPVSIFISDTMAPDLVSYNLDFDSGIIQLTFSETVRVSSISVEEFTIHSSINETSTAYALYSLNSTSEVISSNHHIVSLQISADDQNIIKQMTTLAISRETTYITITNISVFDMFENMISMKYLINIYPQKCLFRVNPK